MTGIAAAASFFRLWAYIIEAPLQILPSWSGKGLRFSPVLVHELSYFPHPGLASLMLRTAPQDPALVKRVLAACEIAPGQRKIGQRVLAQLQAQEAAEHLRQRRFEDLIELWGLWLPGAATDSPLLQALAQLARSLTAAQNSSAPYLAQQNLDLAQQQLQALDNQRLGSEDLIAPYLPDALATARQVLTAMQAETAQAATGALPNPFVAGNPLSGRQRWGMQLFRGREAQVSRVERLLADRDTANSFALLGPRRCGKSTLLNMLRKQLPDTQVVLFDLQDNPADTPLSLYQALARQAQRQAQEDRQLQLPAFTPALAPTDSAIEALKAWLDALEQCPGVTRFLICIDEFERLPSLFPAGEAGAAGRELQQFMGLLRATIQHRQRVRLLVAGAAPFDELERLWTDHFINLQEIGVGFLDHPAAEGLLTAPCPEMPSDAIPPAVAQAMVARSAGQPYLTQLYGQILVDHLNEAERHQAGLSDVEPVERQVLSQGGNYFRNIWSELNPKAQQALTRLAAPQVSADNRPKLDAGTRRYLQRRLLIDEAGTLQPPVFARWLREQVLEEESERVD